MCIICPLRHAIFVHPQQFYVPQECCGEREIPEQRADTNTCHLAATAAAAAAGGGPRRPATAAF